MIRERKDKKMRKVFVRHAAYRWRSRHPIKDLWSAFQPPDAPPSYVARIMREREGDVRIGIEGKKERRMVERVELAV